LIFVEVGAGAEQARLRDCIPLARQRLAARPLRIAEAHSRELRIFDRDNVETRLLISPEATVGTVVVSYGRRPRWRPFRGACEDLIREVESDLASLRTEDVGEATSSTVETCATEIGRETLGCENKRLVASCNGGDMAACNWLGYNYLMGRGLPPDRPAAALLFERACDSGLAKGCYNLGLQLTQGHGIPGDIKRGQALLRKACAGGFEQACRAGQPN
jgi:hypothetical protein